MTTTEKNEKLVNRLIAVFNKHYVKDETTKDDAFFIIHAKQRADGTADAAVRTTGSQETLVNAFFTYALEETDFAKVIGLSFMKVSPVMLNMQRMANMVNGEQEKPCDCAACRFNRGEI